jgi:hypothetical protein
MNARFASRLLPALLALVVGTARAEPTATLWGFLRDDAGQPLPGFSVTFQDTQGARTWSSPPADSQGEFALEVPASGAYAPVAAVGRGGARFPLDGGVPVQVRRPVRYRVDVTIPGVMAPKATESAVPRASRDDAPRAGSDERSPWWKTPGGITALVLAHAAAIAVLLADGDDESPASPFEPVAASQGQPSWPGATGQGPDGTHDPARRTSIE